jgi:hypothetical protein
VTAAQLALEHRPRAVVFNDAGVGREQAGIKGLDYLEQFGIAAAAVSHSTARIGDGADMLARGVISHANAQARALGVAPAQTCQAAVACLALAPAVQIKRLPDVAERRSAVLRGRLTIRVLDSASLVSASDAGQIVVTGSHGGLLGGREETAIKADVLMAFFNDAGIGIDQAGCSRLPALDRRNIAAATVSATSAAIGDGMSTYRDGVISRCNAVAAGLGIQVGASVADAIQIFLAGKSNG